MNMQNLSCAALALLLTAAAAVPLAAQRDARVEGTFGEIVEVRVVNLEVVVEDRDGNRVSGLAPEDFKLFVEGEEMPVDFFSEVAAGTAVTSGEAVADLQGAPGVAAGQAVGTSYLVFFDEMFSVPRDRNLVIDSVIERLGDMGPQDRMAVVAFTGERVEMLTSWEQDRGKLREVLENAKGRRGTGANNLNDIGFNDEDLALNAALDEEIRQALGQNEGIPGQEGDPNPPERISDLDRLPPADLVRPYIRRLERKLEKVVTAATATLRSFAKPPGRKVMFLVSGGWPYSPTDFVVNASAPVIGYGEQVSGERLYGPLFDTANRLGYTIYPIDAPGQRGSSVDASNAGSITGANTLTQELRQRETHSTLHLLAEETGGRALIDGARLDAFDTVISDTRSYYWLGFTPQWRGDDEQRKIEVEIQRPGFKARYRTSFLDMSRSNETSFMVESALLVGELPGAQPLQVQIGQAEKRNFGRIQVPIKVAIPMDLITMLPQGDQYVSDLELRVAVLDEQGNRNDMPVIPMKLQGPSLPEPGQYAVYETEVRMRNRPHSVVIAVYDPLSGTMLSRVMELQL